MPTKSAVKSAASHGATTSGKVGVSTRTTKTYTGTAKYETVKIVKEVTVKVPARSRAQQVATARSIASRNSSADLIGYMAGLSM